MKSQSAIEAKFIRLNVKASSTKLFADLNSAIQKSIKQSIPLLDDEKIVLCYVPQKEYWWAITNCRLILSENHQYNIIDFEDIESIEANDIFDNDVTKQDCTRLELKVHYKYINLEVEKGTWHLIYNIIKFVIN